MRDVYAMNNKTGELIPCEQVISDFYKTHKWNENQREKMPLVKIL